MEKNDDSPKDVKRATSVEREIKRGQKDDTFEGYPRLVEKKKRWEHCKEPVSKKSKSEKSNGDCCERRGGGRKKKSEKFAMVPVAGKTCTFPKLDIIPRHCLTKEAYIDMLATPSRKCPPDCEKKTVLRKLKAISPRIKELAQPTRHRMLITLQEGASILPPALLDNLVRTVEDETCLTPEQAATVSRKRKSRGKKKEGRREKWDYKEARKGRRSSTGVASSFTGSFDRDAVSCQYLMAERFVRSILQWKCSLGKSELNDVAQVIVKRLADVLEYSPLGTEDRKSQQIRYLADLISCWVTQVLSEVGQSQEEKLMERCRKKEEEMRADLEAAEEEEEEEEDEDKDGRKYEELGRMEGEEEEEEEEEEEDFESEEEKEKVPDEVEEPEAVESDEVAKELEEEVEVEVEVEEDVEEIEVTVEMETETQAEPEIQVETEIQTEEKEQVEAEVEATVEVRETEVEATGAPPADIVEDVEEKSQVDLLSASEVAALAEGEKEAEVEALAEMETDELEVEVGAGEEVEEVVEVPKEEEEVGAGEEVEEVVEVPKEKVPSRVEARPPKESEILKGLEELLKSDLPFLTFDKIIDTIYKMIESSPENTGEDPITNGIHRAIYDKLTNIVMLEDPDLLTDELKTVVNVVCGKMANWLRSILSKSQLAFMEQYMPEVESKEIRDWTRWLAYISDVAKDWNVWLRTVIEQIFQMESEKRMVTRGEWQDWTKSVDTNALLWRRFHLQTMHQADRNATMLIGRRVVKTGTKGSTVNPDQSEKLIRTDDLRT